MKAPGELVILRGEADEAGVELDALTEERGQVLDQVIRQTAATKEAQRQLAGLLKGTVIYNARSRVLAGVQAPCFRQIGVREQLRYWSG
jgi:hypothetical protein